METMDTVAFDYLLRLAALSIAFVGFATIVVTLRRGLGEELSPFHMLLVRIYIELGLIVAVGSLLPSLLTLLSLPTRLVWQIPSAVGGTLAPVMMIAFLRRRNRIDPGPMPTRGLVRYVFYSAAVVVLWMNVFGLGFPTSGGPYAVVLTWFLFSAGLIFVQTMDDVLYRTTAK